MTGKPPDNCASRMANSPTMPAPKTATDSPELYARFAYTLHRDSQQIEKYRDLGGQFSWHRQADPGVHQRMRSVLRRTDDTVAHLQVCHLCAAGFNQADETVAGI